MDQILKASGIYKSYRMGKSRLEVLKGVDLSVSDGEFAVIAGASGSGKSTLLHILGSLDRPDGGTVEFQGKRLDKLGGRGLNAFRNREVGFVFQFYHLLDELNLLENVCLPAMVGHRPVGWIFRRGNIRRRAMELLELMGLADRVRHKPYELSGGERQRTAIARALINSPKLLLADEPTGNLDSKTGNDILKVLKDLNRQGQTLLMVTHDERIACQAGRVIRLADGRIV